MKQADAQPQIPSKFPCRASKEQEVSMKAEETEP